MFGLLTETSGTGNAHSAQAAEHLPLKHQVLEGFVTVAQSAGYPFGVVSAAMAVGFAVVVVKSHELVAETVRDDP